MNIEYYTYYGYSIYFLQYNCVISFCILQNAVQKQDLRWYFAAVSLNISAKVFPVSSVLQTRISVAAAAGLQIDLETAVPMHHSSILHIAMLNNYADL